jgi:HK97 family phage major capsid protein
MKSTPAERDAMALAKLYGLDPRDVSRGYARAANRTLDTIDVDGHTVPRNSEDLANWLATDAPKLGYTANPQAMATFMTRYAAAVQPVGGEVDKQVVDQAGASVARLAGGSPEGADQATAAQWFQAQMVEFLKNNPGAADALNLNARRPVNEIEQRRRGAAYNPHAAGAKIDSELPDVVEMLRAMHPMAEKSASHPGYATRQKLEKIRNDYATNIPASAGFLVPEQFRSEIMSVAISEALVRPRARTIPMSTMTLNMPFLDSTTNVGSVFGGMIAYWTEEGAELVESEARFGRIKLEAHKLTGRSDVTNELLADAPAFRAFIEATWPRAIRWYEDLAFIRGTGVGEPLGFLGAGNAAAIAQAAEGGQTASTVVLENIVRMYSRMLPSSLNSAVWLVAPNVLPELFTMALSVGTGGSAVYLTNVTGQAPMTILGRPVIVDEKLNTLGTRGDIAFVDLNYYLIGDRQVMQMDASEHALFTRDMTVFRIISRVDGRPWLQSAITPQYNGDTLSPFVELATRS